MSYATWAEGCKTDLCVMVPELKDFIEHAEDPDFDPLDLKTFFSICELSETTAKGLDTKLWGLLHNLTRDHSTAHAKINSNNQEENGMIAWNTLKLFYREEDE